MRLSDWLAPDDELVPFGPRAHAARPPAERPSDSGAQAPAAAGFWDGDTSMHTAVPGPELFADPLEQSAEPRRYRRSVLGWRLSLPRLRRLDWGIHARDAIADFVDRISWPWVAAGLASAVLIVVGLLAALGTAPSHHGAAAQAGIGDQPRPTLSQTLVETGGGASASAAMALRRLPSPDTAAWSIGASAHQAQALRSLPKRRAHLASASTADVSASTAAAVDTTTSSTPTEPAPAPVQTEPVQTTSTPTPASGGGSSSGGGSNSNSNSQKQPAFGANGSLAPGSSPNG